VSKTALVRTAPVQQRSAERVNALLDAAAQLLDEHGIDALTTSEVSKRAHSSVGVIYRYFPHIESLLHGLAARNFEKYLAALSTRLELKADNAIAALNTAVDVYLDLCRSEAGFRVLSFGNMIDRSAESGQPSVNAEMAEIFRDMLVSTYDVHDSEALAFDIEVSVGIAESLLERAFLHDPDGDQAFIDKLRELVAQLLAPHMKDAPTA